MPIQGTTRSNANKYDYLHKVAVVPAASQHDVPRLSFVPPNCQYFADLQSFQSAIPIKTRSWATMAGVKRSREGPKAQSKTGADSPYISIFETFRAELDEHHDRREKIIKASRDMTASSKKM